MEFQDEHQSREYSPLRQFALPSNQQVRRDALEDPQLRI